MPDAVRVTGRVIKVRPDYDGSVFAVTVGPPPDLFWFRANRPPKLGQKVRVLGEVARRDAIGTGSLKGSVTQLINCDFEAVADSYTKRVVPRVWLDRVASAMGRPLYPYQADGAAWMASRLAKGTGSILGDDPGLGKSAQTVATLCALQAFPAVVVCPHSLKAHWASEFRYASHPPSTFIINGKRSQIYPADVFIINYELLWPREAQLDAIGARVFVFDEAQNLKHPKARGKHRAAVATRLVRKTPGALLLTGTPVMNRPIELWRLLHLASPKEWPGLTDYQRRYCAPRKGKERGRSVMTKSGRVERLDELHAAVGPFMLRRLKHQVLADLPQKSRRRALVTLGASAQAHYRKADRDVAAWLKDMGHAQRAANAKGPQAGLVKLTMLRRIAAMGKMQGAVPEYLAQWTRRNAAEPLVIFGYHRDVMRGLWDICRRLGMRVTGIGGAEGAAKRQANIEAFQRGMADVFLASIKTGGTGLNLQRASEALFVERDWSPSVMTQAEDRVHRIGQQRPVTITYIDAVDTVDEHMAEVLSDKQRLIGAVVDDNLHAAESLATVSAVLERMTERRR